VDVGGFPEGLSRPDVAQTGGEVGEGDPHPLRFPRAEYFLYPVLVDEEGKSGEEGGILACGEGDADGSACMSADPGGAAKVVSAALVGQDDEALGGDAAVLALGALKEGLLDVRFLDLLVFAGLVPVHLHPYFSYGIFVVEDLFGVGVDRVERHGRSLPTPAVVMSAVSEPRTR